MKTALGIIFWMAVIYFIYSGIEDSYKYEGMTAREWFDVASEYEQEVADLKSCVEDYPEAAYDNCL